MFDHWKQCSVRFASDMEEGVTGTYDKDNDVIYLDLNPLMSVETDEGDSRLPTNPLITYLCILYWRDYRDKKPSEWIVEQATTLWHTMSTHERWMLLKMLVEKGEEP